MPELERYQTCSLCGSPDAFILVTQEELTRASRFRDQLFEQALPRDTPDFMFQDLTRFTQAYPARLVECYECGLVTRDPRLAAHSALEAFGKDTYDPRWLEAAFRDYYHAFVTRMPDLVKTVGREASVLEVGSYVGGFLAAARDFGWRAKGVDIGRQVSESCRRRGLDVLTGTLAEAHFPDGAFDAVFCWVCFDQLPDPRNTLAEIHRVLRAEGWLYVQVPNGEFVKLVHALLDVTRVGIVREIGWKALAYTGMAGFPYQVGHTPATLRRLFAECGFSRASISNRVNVNDGRSGSALPKPREQLRYVRRIQRISQAINYLSLYSLVKGPWAEAAARKA